MTVTKAKGAAKAAAGRAESAAADSINEIGADLGGRLEELSDIAQKSFGEAVEMGEEAVTKVRDFVEEEPWKAVAIAGVLGLLIGLAARR